MPIKITKAGGSASGFFHARPNPGHLYQAGTRTKTQMSCVNAELR